MLRIQGQRHGCECDRPEPLEGATVGIPSGASARTDADGRFTLNQVLAGSFNASRTVTVTASKEGFGSASRQISVFCDGDITLDFGQPSGGFGVVFGQVTDGDGDPMPGVQIGASFGEAAMTDGDGRYRLIGLRCDTRRRSEGLDHLGPPRLRQPAGPGDGELGRRGGAELPVDAVNTPPDAHDQAVTTTGTDPVGLTLTGFDPNVDATTSR